MLLRNHIFLLTLLLLPSPLPFGVRGKLPKGGQLSPYPKGEG